MKEANKKNSNQKSNKSNATDWLKNFNSGQVIDNANQLLSTAVNVLEEEIAAGILAAKKIEKKFIDVDEVRSNTELMGRIRNDVHEAVDIFLDAIAVLTDHFSSLTGQIKPIVKAQKQNQTTSNYSMIENEELAIPGKTIELKLNLTNDSKEIMNFDICKSNLIGPNNHIIKMESIIVSPQKLSIEPNQNIEISLKIKILKSCLSGTYSGLIFDSDNKFLRTLININVQ